MKWLRSIFRGIKVPGTYTIIFAMILLSALLTWFVPGGEYVKGEEGTLSYRDVESVPQLFGVFTALYHGFVKQSGIIIFILIVGGSFWLLNSTGAISVGIGRFIRSVGRYHKVVLVAITLLFSLAGAIFGMSEETIPFVGIVVPLVVSMGYDAFLGMLIVYVAANVGFSSAFLNPFTVGIAQEMAELPLFSGMEYRLFCWAILTLLLILFVLFYAKSVYKAPQAAAEQQTFAALQSTAAPQPTSAPLTSALTASAIPSTPVNGSCRWMSCLSISAPASTARHWLRWRNCKRKTSLASLFSDTENWLNSRSGAGGVTTRSSTTTRPVRRRPAFSSSPFQLLQSWSAPVIARRWTPCWICG